MSSHPVRWGFRLSWSSECVCPTRVVGSPNQSAPMGYTNSLGRDSMSDLMFLFQLLGRAILGAFSSADIVLKAQSASAESEIRRHPLHRTWRKSLLQAGNLSGPLQQFESTTNGPLMGGNARC